METLICAHLKFLPENYIDGAHTAEKEKRGAPILKLNEIPHQKVLRSIEKSFRQLYSNMSKTSNFSFQFMMTK